MNIQNRLRKLEDKMIIGEGYCECQGTPKFEIYKADLSAGSDDSTPLLVGQAVPDICPACRKLIAKQQFILQGVDHTTKDRFPEEWNS